MNKKIMLFLSLLIFTVTAIQAETRFVKYKQYMIPVQTGQNCEIDTSIPHVFYIDDVEDSRTKSFDPNGVQELPILIGWHNKGYYNLVGIGADGITGMPFNTAFSQDLINRTGSNLQVKTGSGLADELIKEALKFEDCGEQKLQVAIGGPWHSINTALTTARTRGTPIDDFIKVIGIGGSNIAGVRNAPRQAIIGSIGASNVYTINETQFRRFFNVPNSFVGNKNSWYINAYHNTNVGARIRNLRFDEINLRLNYCFFGSDRNKAIWFCNNSIDGRTGIPPNSEIPNNERYIFRGADFTALAYIIWGESTWTMTSNMYTDIASGLSTLP